MDVRKMRKLATSLIMCMLLTGTLLTLAPRTQAQGGAPSWQVGNHWTYAGEAVAGPNTINMTQHLHVNKTTSVVAGGTTYPVFELKTWSNLTIIGPSVQQYANITGHGYYSTANYATVKIEYETLSTSVLPPSPPTTLKNETTYDPPLRNLEFPLSHGQTWSVTTRLNTSLDGAPEIESNETWDYSVKGPYSIVTPAGTFSAFNVSQSKPGSAGPTTQGYYSDIVGNYVRMAVDMGGAFLNVDLLHYSYAPNSAPSTPTITFSPTAVHRNTVVTFTAASTDLDGDTVTYAWTFGDSGTGTGSTTTHTYLSMGTFTVTVTASDGKGGTATNSTTVTVTNRAPEAITTDFTPKAPEVGALVTFAAVAIDLDADTVTYAWKFGDGGTGTGIAPTHTYASAGTFTVNVTASDGQGGSSYKEFTITVKEKAADNTMLYIIIIAVVAIVAIGAALAMRGRKGKIQEPPAQP